MGFFKKLIKHLRGLWGSGVTKESKPSPAPIEVIQKEPTHLDTLEEIEGRLINEAMKWVGIRESGGSNKGKEVEAFQRAVDGKAQGEPWCLSFVQFVVSQVCESYGVANPLFATEHCQTVYNNTAKRYLRKLPERGFIFIMKSRTSSSGHTGFCLNREREFETLEGNTNSIGSREGDGVYVKTRFLEGTASMSMRGFIDVPMMIYDELSKAKNP